MEHRSRIFATALGKSEFLLVEQAQVLFEIGNRRRLARNPLADTGKGIFRIRTQSPVGSCRTCSRIIPESVIRDVAGDIRKRKPIAHRHARRSKQVDGEEPCCHILFRQVGEIVHAERAQDLC